MNISTQGAVAHPGLVTAAPAATTARPVRGLSICIPVFNEEGAVGETLERCLALGDALRRAGIDDFEVIAVDDGSARPDGRGHRAATPRVRLIRHERNRGYGAALKTGFAAARYDLIGFLDADATYPPEQFPRLCEAVLKDGADLVIGSRMAGAASEMPRVRRIGNTFFAGMLTLIGRTPVTDSASGMRVFRRTVLDLLVAAARRPQPDAGHEHAGRPRGHHRGRGADSVPRARRAVEAQCDQGRHPVPHDDGLHGAGLQPGSRSSASSDWPASACPPPCSPAWCTCALTGVTTLGPLGTFAVFAALVSGVAGVSVFALGATFNYLVSLFYNRPIRQGLFKKPLLKRPVERLFLPAGLASGLSGGLVAAGAFVLARRGWPIERLWMYLTGSAMAMLIGVQLILWWLMASVLRELSARTASHADRP